MKKATSEIVDEEMQKDTSCFRTVIQIMLLSCVCACLFVRVQFFMHISNLTLSNFSHLASQHLIIPFYLFLFLSLSPSFSLCQSVCLSLSLSLFVRFSLSLHVSLRLFFFFTYHRCRCHLPGSAGAIDLLQSITPHFLNSFATKTRKCKKKRKKNY